MRERSARGGHRAAPAVLPPSRRARPSERLAATLPAASAYLPPSPAWSGCARPAAVCRGVAGRMRSTTSTSLASWRAVSPMPRCCWMRWRPPRRRIRSHLAHRRDLSFRRRRTRPRRPASATPRLSASHRSIQRWRRSSPPPSGASLRPARVSVRLHRIFRPRPLSSPRCAPCGSRPQCARCSRNAVGRCRLRSPRTSRGQSAFRWVTWRPRRRIARRSMPPWRMLWRNMA